MRTAYFSKDPFKTVFFCYIHYCCNSPNTSGIHRLQALWQALPNSNGFALRGSESSARLSLFHKTFAQLPVPGETLFPHHRAFSSHFLGRSPGTDGEKQLSRVKVHPAGRQADRQEPPSPVSALLSSTGLARTLARHSSSAPANTCGWGEATVQAGLAPSPTFINAATGQGCCCHLLGTLTGPGGLLLRQACVLLQYQARQTSLQLLQPGLNPETFDTPGGGGGGGEGAACLGRVISPESTSLSLLASC